MKVILIFSMLFMHIVDDYYLQGILASMKQKSWWVKQEGYNDKYKNDYLVALLMHAFSWSFCIHIPLVLYSLYTGLINNDSIFIFFGLSMNINFIIHAIVDDLKANKKKINLVQDQSVHVIQIITTYIIFLLLEAFTNG